MQRKVLIMTLLLGILLPLSSGFAQSLRIPECKELLSAVEPIEGKFKTIEAVKIKQDTWETIFGKEFKLWEPNDFADAKKLSGKCLQESIAPTTKGSFPPGSSQILGKIYPAIDKAQKERTKLIREEERSARKATREQELAAEAERQAAQAEKKEQMLHAPLPCLSGVCLGTDVATLNVKWQSQDQLVSWAKGIKEDRFISRAKFEVNDKFKQSKGLAGNAFRSDAKEFLQKHVANLDATGAKILTTYIAASFFDTQALQILGTKHPVFCRESSLTGFFFSESGYLTQVNIAPDTDQKWKVVVITRYFGSLDEIERETLGRQLVKEYPDLKERSLLSLAEFRKDSLDNYELILRHPSIFSGDNDNLGRWVDSFMVLKKLREKDNEVTLDAALSGQPQCQKNISIN